MEIANFILSLWGAILSSLLGIIAITQIKPKLYILGNSEAPFDFLYISIGNIGNRPITITKIYISLGGSKKENTILIVKKLGHKKLEESDAYVEKIRREEIQKEAKNKALHTEGHYQRLWVIVESSTGTKYAEVAHINPDILGLPDDTNIKAEMFYRATDVFVGFSPKPHRTIGPTGHRL